ncbi:hypothetical protein I6N98_11290 [Spongiibacter nanhainus]|uniref:Uncharacterized protein n=1 Tax=Spongiibacter nanhainus TaxID=2794344 RepID=A0A7T4QYC4_9GAMM|nr:hypothetical protein [Spongiibacter nanhainus]QQD16964.1 hypothetical protein I6N98_11290 [Spongiibacter nanhainus]
MSKSSWQIASRCLAVSIFLCLAGLASAAEPDNFDQAYRDQRAKQLQLLAGEPPFGFKAGLTSLASREAFGSDRSVAGVLRQGSRSGSALSLGNFGKGRVEMELAYQLAEPVSEPVASEAALRAKVARVAPALEFPDLALLGAKPESVLAIVRGNVAAHRAVVGAATELVELEPNELTARLFRDEQRVSTSRASAVIGGQWQALLSLINTLVAAGWTLYPDQWLLTGALDGMHPLQAGRYRLVVDGLDELEVDVAAAATADSRN